MFFFVVLFQLEAWLSLTKFNFKFPTMCSKCYVLCETWFSFFFVKYLNTSVDDFFLFSFWEVGMYRTQSHSRKISKYFLHHHHHLRRNDDGVIVSVRAFFSCLISCYSLFLAARQCCCLYAFFYIRQHIAYYADQTMLFTI